MFRLNEVQFPKELQLSSAFGAGAGVSASMKCSSRRNCNSGSMWVPGPVTSLNEVQFPKELQRESLGDLIDAREPQ